MQRLKVLGGVLSAEQWRALAAVSRELTGAPLHLTTRQDIELHDIAADNVPAVQRALAAAAMTGAGACGDTLRNLTVCPCSGASRGCADLLPLARRIREALEAEDGITALPRKFKIALSCGAGCGQPFLNDLGFVARRRDGRWGFFVTGGGSLGARPACGIPLLEHLPAGDVVALCVAAIRLFAAHGDREHRNRARFRHVRQRVGDSQFAAMIREAFEKTKAERPWPAVELDCVSDSFEARLRLTVPNGDVTPAAADALGDLAGRDGFRLRIAPHHQVHLFAADAAALAEAVSGGALAEAAREQPSVVACPGTRWCSRALVDTNRLADRLRAELAGRAAPDLTVCISGCPNGCGHSAAAEIGLIGKLTSRDGRKIECYDLLVGGAMGRTDKLAELRASKLTADEVSDAVLGALERL